jgi:hypothetical protein
VTQTLQQPRDPLADRAGFHQQIGPRAIRKVAAQPLVLGPHPLLDQLPGLRDNGDLTLLLPEIHANMVHG